MADDLRIVEVQDGLRISVKVRPTFHRVLLTTIIVGLCFGVLARVASRSSAWYLAAIVGAGAGLISSARIRRSELHAGNLDFATTYNGIISHTRSVVSRADIQTMYFDREHGGGDDGPSYPKGLYADLGSDEVCLLGYISEEQSIEVATAIYHRFPDMPLKKSSPKKHITSLGLSV